MDTTGRSEGGKTPPPANTGPITPKSTKRKERYFSPTNLLGTFSGYLKRSRREGDKDVKTTSGSIATRPGSSSANVDGGRDVTVTVGPTVSSVGGLNGSVTAPHTRSEIDRNSVGASASVTWAASTNTTNTEQQQPRFAIGTSSTRTRLSLPSARSSRTFVNSTDAKKSVGFSGRSSFGGPSAMTSMASKSKFALTPGKNVRRRSTPYPKRSFALRENGSGLISGGPSSNFPREKATYSSLKPSAGLDVGTFNSTEDGDKNSLETAKSRNEKVFDVRFKKGLSALGRSGRRIRVSSSLFTSLVQNEHAGSEFGNASSFKDREKARRKQQANNNELARRILEETAKSARPLFENSLFHNSNNGNTAMTMFGPPKKKIGLNRVLGLNQTGGNRLMSTSNGREEKMSDVVRERRQNSQNGAFAEKNSDGTSSQTGAYHGSTDFWTRQQQSNNPKNSSIDNVYATDNGKSQPRQLPTTESVPVGTAVAAASANKIRVSFHLPATNKENNKSLHFASTPMQKTPQKQKIIMPSHSTPLPYSKPSDGWVGIDLTGYDSHGEKLKRDDMDGSVSYQPITMNGQEIDFAKILCDGGKGSCGVTMTEVTDEIDLESIGKKHVMSHPFSKETFSPKSVATDTDNNKEVTSKEETVDNKKKNYEEKNAAPFNFMTKTVGESKSASAKKGSSSILNKDIKMTVLSSAKKDDSNSTKASVVASSTGNAANGIHQSVATTAASKATSGWGTMFAAKPGEWKCNGCFTKNPPDVVKCLACEMDKPNVSSECAGPNKTAKGTEEKDTKSCGLSNITPETKTPSSSGWGTMFAAKPGEWKCGDCLTKNPKDVMKCLACEKDKPNAGGDDGGSKKAMKDVKEAPTFSFGGSNTSSTSASTPLPIAKFSFGSAVPAGGSETASESVALSFEACATQAATSKPDTVPDKKEQVKFGRATGSTSMDSTSTLKTSFGRNENLNGDGATFTFSSSNNSQANKVEPSAIPEPSSSNGASFSFGLNNSSAATPAKSGGFTFSNTATQQNDIAKDSSKKKRDFCSSEDKVVATPSKANFPFEFNAVTNSQDPSVKDNGNDEAVKSTSIQNVETKLTPSFTFGSTSSTNAPVIQPAMFGASKDTEPSKKRRATVAADVPKQSPKPMTFGQSSTETSTSTNPSSGLSFSFGSTSGSAGPPSTISSTANSAPSAPSAPAFSFGTTSSAPAPAATTTQSSGPAFSFGSSSTPAVVPANPAPSFSFGSSANPQQVGQTGSSQFSFGNSSTNPAPSGPAFDFGSSTTGQQAGGPAVPAFSFGTAAPTPSSSAQSAMTATGTQSFSFGANTTSSIAPSSTAPTPASFGFNPAPSVNTPKTTGFGSSGPMGASVGMVATPAAGGFSIGTGGGKSGSTRGRRIVRGRRPPGTR